MANREKGEGTVVIDGKTYTMLIDLHAWALVQDALSKGEDVPSLDLIDRRLRADHLLTIVATFWASLQRYHAKDVPDLRSATRLFERSDGDASAALIKAVNRSNADDADLKELGVSANPPTAQDAADRNGTGDSSRSKPDASA